MTDERERRKSSGIGNGPRKSPILHFYAISIPTELVPSSSKLVVRVFTTNYARIVNAFGRDPSRPFFFVKYERERKGEREIITVTSIYLNAFKNGNMNWEGINCRYEKSKIVPHSVECQACSISCDFSGFKRSQESRFWILMKGYEYIHRG